MTVMKALPPFELEVKETSVRSFDELEEVRARLVRAQRIENLAIRQLSKVSSRTTMDRESFNRLMAKAQETRRASLAAYEDWLQAVERFRGTADGIPAERNREV
jgi:hypothetical protein